MKPFALASTLALVILVATFSHGSIFLPNLDNRMTTTDSLSTPSTTLEVWNPDLRSSNITSTTLFPPGSQFSVRVNLTDPAPIAGFDITLNYNITNGPNILQAVKTGSELSGGLFDPNTTPAGCSVVVLRNQIDIPPGRIRFAAVMSGGCVANGVGTLFTITFNVTGWGASFIDIVRTNSGGQAITTIVSGPPSVSPVPYQPVDARFQNVPGIPPVALFTYNPSFPVKGDIVNFNGRESFDPISGDTISRYLWIFGDGSVPQAGVNQTHVFINPVQFPISGNFTTTMIVWDSTNNLPGRINVVVDVTAGIGQTDSLNWSGYAISAAPGTIVTDVKGSWIVPSIVGACGSVDQHSSFWVGIDGLVSSTVEQLGTESACIKGTATYFAWYEFYPQVPHRIQAIRASPGDTIYAEVRYSAGQFNLTMVDWTTGKSFTKLGSVKSPQLSSAEWIAEAPSSRTGIVPLADFGSVKFGQDLPGVSGTCYATVSGVAGPIGSFGSRVFQITMVAPDFTVKAQPSTLTTDLSSFTVVWKWAGK